MIKYPRDFGLVYIKTQHEYIPGQHKDRPIPTHKRRLVLNLVHIIQDLSPPIS